MEGKNKKKTTKWSEILLDIEEWEQKRKAKTNKLNKLKQLWKHQ